MNVQKINVQTNTFKGLGDKNIVAIMAKLDNIENKVQDLQKASKKEHQLISEENLFQLKDKSFLNDYEMLKYQNFQKEHDLNFHYIA